MQGWSGVFVSWPPYAIAATGLCAMFLAQNAFHAGPITASQSTLIMVDPLVSIGLGVGLFGDQLQTGGVRGPGEAIGLVVLMIGVFSLARSPLIAGVRSEADAQEHILSSRPHGLSSRRRVRSNSRREAGTGSSTEREGQPEGSGSAGSAVRGSR